MSKKYFFFLLFLLVLLFLRFTQFYSQKPEFKDGERVELEAVLLTEPKVIRNFQRLSINYKGERLTINTNSEKEFKYGDRVKINGNIKYWESAVSQKNGLLNKKRVVKIIDFPEIELVKIKSSFSIHNNMLAVVYFFRQNFKDFFDSNLPPVSSQLAQGIVFGIRDSINKEFYDELKITGVMHVVAASGMNVTIVAGFLASVFSLFFKRQLAVLFSIFGIVFYAFLAGLEPSIVRAAIMGSIVFTAQILGRQTLAFHSLILTGFLMLFVSPGSFFDIGFQLSFLATLGLIYINPYILSRIPYSKTVFGESFSTTLSAQAATMPVLLTNFGLFSIWGILVNVIVLWTILPIMVVAGVSSLVAFVFEPLGKIILYFSIPFLFFFEATVNFFSLLPGTFSFNFPWQLTVSYYLLILAAFLFKRKNEKSN